MYISVECKRSYKYYNPHYQQHDMLQTFDMILCFHRRTTYGIILYIRWWCFFLLFRKACCRLLHKMYDEKEGCEILNIMGNMQRHESNCTYLKIITRIERQKTFIMCFEMVFGLCIYLNIMVCSGNVTK